jgi:hypothetical protein
MQFELVCCGARERDRVGFCGNDVKLCSHTRTLYCSEWIFATVFLRTRRKLKVSEGSSEKFCFVVSGCVKVVENKAKFK